MPWAAKAAAQAHRIEEKASAKVAMRDEVCRRRNWLRRRLRAEPELDRGRRGGRDRDAARRPRTRSRATAIATPRGSGRRRATTDRAEHRLDLGPHDLAGRDRRGRDEIGRVLARDGEPGEAARELARRHHEHRDEHGERVVALAEAAPQQQRGRHQIEDLHQGLRHQPGIAREQRPFLLAQHPRGACGTGSAGRLRPGGPARPRARRPRPRERRSARDDDRDHGREAGRATPPTARARLAGSPSSARAGHPDGLSGRRRPRDDAIGGQDREPRRIVEGQDRDAPGPRSRRPPRSIAATICAARRVRPGRAAGTGRPSAPSRGRRPRCRAPRAPHRRASQRGPSRSDQDVDERARRAASPSASRARRDPADPHGEQAARRHRRGQDEVEIAARIEGAGHGSRSPARAARHQDRSAGARDEDERARVRPDARRAQRPPRSS